MADVMRAFLVLSGVAPGPEAPFSARRAAGSSGLPGAMRGAGGEPGEGGAAYRFVLPRQGAVFRRKGTL